MNEPYSILVLFTLSGSIFTIQLIISIVDPYGVKWSFIISIFLFIIQVTVFMIFRKFSEATHIKYLKDFYQKNLLLFQDQAQSVARTDINMKTVYHDLRHHFLTLDGYANAISDYLNNVMQNIQLKDPQIIANTRCIAVDSIINQKYEIARGHHIDFKADLAIFPDIMFDSVSLSIILGNALDNALEATLKVPEKERYIKITMDYDMCHNDYHTLDIEVENTYLEKIVTNKSNDILTTKKDDQHHGIGIKSIRQEVKKYRGNCHLEYSDKVFIIKVKLYATREEQAAYYERNFLI